jgi:hypothetical protein
MRLMWTIIFTSDELALGKWSLGIRRMGGSVGHEICLGAFGKREACFPVEIKPRLSRAQPGHSTA